MQFINQARRKNKEYQQVYGTESTGAHAPRWTADDGDKVALQRIPYPNFRAQKYWDGPVYNAHVRNLATTATQGTGKKMSDAVSLKGMGGYHPDLNRAVVPQATQYNQVSLATNFALNQYTMAAGLIVLGLGFIYLV